MCLRQALQVADSSGSSRPNAVFVLSAYGIVIVIITIGIEHFCSNKVVAETQNCITFNI